MNLKTSMDRLVEAGLVARRTHLKGRLHLYCYTTKCQIDEAWDDVSIMARGIVIDNDGNIISRPFDKFFNLGERESTKLKRLPPGVPEISEKVDGSMVTLFWDKEEGWLCTTKGSWDSPQAKAAYIFLLKRLGGFTSLDREKTYVLEYVAPWNRVVVPYSEEAMYLLAIRAKDGSQPSYSETALIAADMGLLYPTFRLGEVHTLDMRAGTGCAKEGYVAYWPDLGFRVKLKFEDYKDLHRIVTGFSVRSIWKMLANGQLLDLPPDNLPDEFYSWFIETRDKLKHQFEVESLLVEQIFSTTHLKRDRKGIAIDWQAQPSHTRAALFRKLDNKAYAEVIWKAIEPSGSDAWFGRDKEGAPDGTAG